MSELNYLNILRELSQRSPTSNRTNVKARSVFGREIRFDCSDGQIPIITTKRVYYKTAFKEMIWMLNGGRNIKELVDQNVNIWNEWPLKRYNVAHSNVPDMGMDEFVEKIKTDLTFAATWGDLGPVYGYTWRNWPDPKNSSGKIDQVARVIDQIKTQPDSRRIIWEGWNVAEIDNMALPPCHKTYQFNVDSSSQEIDLIVFQRSADIFLGVPFNIVNAALVLHLIAHNTGYKPRELIWYGANVHLYENHLDQVRAQLMRAPYEFPTIKINPYIKDLKTELISINDIVIQDYQHHGALKGAVAV
jgi:thymidylate synthase